MHKQYLASNNLQWLICHKTKLPFWGQREPKSNGNGNSKIGTSPSDAV